MIGQMRRSRHWGRFLCLALALSTSACQRPDVTQDPRATAIDALAEHYVELALSLRRFDGDYVDAYFGPEALAHGSDTRTLSDLRADAARLVEQVTAAGNETREALDARRLGVLRKRLDAMLLRMDMVAGRYLPFDDESMILFDARAPDLDAADFAPTLERIDALVPGEGSLAQRLETFRARFEIPADRLEAVMQAAIDECRRRTLAHIDLPEGERFSLEFVSDQPWSGYNWYKGGYYSVIQINTDLPIFIERAVDLGCHEGYPGHHTYNVLLEQNLVVRRGWIEFSLSPLYGPQSLISEGSANYGIELAFPDEERRAFEQTTLFPLAGLDPALADRYYDLQDALTELGYAGNEAARDYLDGRLGRDAAVEWLVTYTASTRERAAQRVRFFDKYRSYVINYNLGRDLVGAYVERDAADVQTRWQAFQRLLVEPFAAGDLR